MKRKFACSLVIGALTLITLASSAQSDCSTYSSEHPAFKWSGLQPLILLTEYNPWAMAVGSDTPTFALYVDGTVIYWQGDRRAGKYVTANLPPSQVSILINTAHLDNVEHLTNCYSIFDGTDAPTNVLVVKTPQGYKSIEVYGSIRDMEGIPADRLPTELQTAFKTLLAFRSDQAKPWQPPYFEVFIWPFTYAKSAVTWPIDFPDLADRNTLKGKSGYNLFVPISKLNEYEGFVRKLKQTQAVLIDGKKWTTSTRFPFPHEGAPIPPENTHP
ncbi:MAG: hypothetical protein ABSG84_02510 [Acidobacteriaceae bacterium]|jgi:hypothetical protein